ncbi:hypothetical protein BLNAU_254 [Blattamonas nauphoetae]|uniref:Uncharacterized protein n=1 Tax=Blattamonas nauphoetae TaxID=2049346 RepID=A0ABQ9YMH1_9EUKA|nr:hypothetical protein BLNAU_254 [Blattamonas nauphoetae]
MGCGSSKDNDDANDPEYEDPVENTTPKTPKKKKYKVQRPPKIVFRRSTPRGAPGEPIDGVFFSQDPMIHLDINLDPSDQPQTLTITLVKTKDEELDEPFEVPQQIEEQIVPDIRSSLVQVVFSTKKQWSPGMYSISVVIDENVWHTEPFIIVNAS